MSETTAKAFQQNIERDVARCIENHEVLHVARNDGKNFVVIGEADWKAIAETIFLNQVPGLVDSIQEADREPIEEGTSLKDVQW